MLGVRTRGVLAIVRAYKHGPTRRAANVVMAALARSGVGPGYLQILTTKGRKTGRATSNPVQLVIEGDRKWLVAPYGRVSWVKNAIATGRVTLSRGRKRAEYRIEPADERDAGRVLKKYVKMAPIVLRYFEAGIASSEEEFAAEAKDHPVFELWPTTSDAGG